MEFDPPTDLKSSTPDEERIAAETRKKTLNPMNPFIKPEDIPDPIAVNTPQANILRDSENTAQSDSLIQPSPSIKQQLTLSRKPKNPIIATIVIISPILLAIGFVLSLTQ